jgi:arylsulfatase
MGHVPTDVAPDVRSRSYVIEAEVEIDETSEGVLIAHGDATSGYSLYVRERRLVHDLNIGGEHLILTSDRPVPIGRCRLGVRATRVAPAGPGPKIYTLLIDGGPAGTVQAKHGFANFISWSGLDIGRDRGSPVSHYEAPFEFTGTLERVTVTMDDDQALDGAGVGRAEMARQ